MSGYYVDCIGGGLHWIESGQMGVHWMAIKLDWFGLATRRGIVDEMRSRAEIQISQMPTTDGRQFFLEVVKN